MKKIFTILFSVFVASTSYGQLVPNGGFETNGVWSGLNATYVSSVKITTQSGSEQLNPVNDAKFGFLQSTNSTAFIAQKFAYSQRPNSFRYMYCYLPAGAGEVALALVRLTKYNTTTQKVDTLLNVAIGMNAGSYPWKEVIVELSDKYKIAGNPDTAYVLFSNSAGSTHLQGTTLTLDNIKFSANSASTKEIADANRVLVGKSTISPNPVNTNATISYQINTKSDVKIELYDMTGKMIKEIANEKELNFGKYTAELDVNDIDAGIYFYKITTGSYSTTEKIIVSK